MNLQSLSAGWHHIAAGDISGKRSRTRTNRRASFVLRERVSMAAQVSSGVLDSRSLEGGGADHAKRLFLGCFFSIFATSSAFIVRAMVITEWGTTFNLTEAQKGAIFPGAALFPFAISIVLFSLFIDRIGYGKTMGFAVVAHLVGTVVTILATKATTTNSAYQL